MHMWGLSVRRRACAVQGALDGHVLTEEQAVQRASERVRVRLEAPWPPLRHLAAAERVRLRVGLHAQSAMSISRMPLCIKVCMKKCCLLVHCKPAT